MFPCFSSWIDVLSTRQLVQAVFVMLWATRLGLFLVTRAWSHGDRRFKKAKESAVVFLIYWIIQGVWVFITLLPSLILISSSSDVALGLRDYGRKLVISCLVL
jgi:steroid 5-alpha reductase family enzyme